MGGRGGKAMQTWAIPGWPGANAKRERTITPPGWSPWNLGMGWSPARDMLEAHAWMGQDMSNRMVECVQRFPWGQDQVLWERVDKSKPIGFTDGGGIRWLSFYPEAERGRGGPGPCEPGGCLHNYTASDEFKKEMTVGEAGQVWLELWLYYPLA